ncbi:MAG: PAS domain S-box protein [Deltaproteobacteria bacterium]|nr:PAS domain S-box protein [Deltaproteobacteria bacterium]
MFRLDLRTVILSTSLIITVLSVGMSLLWKRDRSRDMGYWALAYCLSSIGGLLYSINDLIPSFFSTIIAVMFLLAGYVSLYKGTCLFLKIQRSIKPLIIVLFATCISAIYFSYVNLNLTSRVLTVSLSILLVNAALVQVIGGKVTRDNWPSYLIPLICFISPIIAMTARMILTISENLPGEIMSSGNYQSVTLLILPLSAAGSIIGFTNMYAARATGNLRQSQARYKLLFQMANDLVMLHPILPEDYLNQPFYDVNDLTCQVLGYTREEMLCLTPLDITDAAQQHFNYLKAKALAAKGRLLNEIYFKTKSGQLIPMEINTNVFDFQGQTMALSIARDISHRKKSEEALKESEEQFRATFDYAAFGMGLVDTEGCFFRVNESFRKLLGYSDEELHGKTFKEVTHPDDLAISLQYFNELKSGQTDYVWYEKRYLRRDGVTIWCLTSVSAVRRSNGELIHLVSMVQDISARKQAEWDRDRLITELRALVKEVHHRVKNNMQSLVSMLKLQLRREKDPLVIEAIRESQSRIMAMALVHESLYRSKSLARIGFERYLAGLIQALRNSLTFGGRAVNILLEVPPKLTISPDQAVTCGLILNELVTNAFKYAFPDDRKGEIRVQVQNIGSGQVALTVMDNGVGLPPGLDLRSAESLGFSLVKMLAEGQLNGELHVSGRSGTEFRIVFRLDDL